jgi:hypothetical protein
VAFEHYRCVHRGGSPLIESELHLDVNVIDTTRLAAASLIFFSLQARQLPRCPNFLVKVSAAFSARLG